MADDAGRINQVLSETSFLYGANAAFVEDLYARFAEAPDSVEASWRVSSSSWATTGAARQALAEPSWTRPSTRHGPSGLDVGRGRHVAGRRSQDRPRPSPSKTPAASPEQIRAATLDSVRAIMMIRAYRMRGHLRANLDPLGLPPKGESAELDPAVLRLLRGRLRPSDLPRLRPGPGDRRPLREILEILRRTYCGDVGVQYMHISDPDEKAWLQERIEGRGQGDRLHARGQGRDPQEADRGRGLRALPAQALPRHQALRPGRRRGHGPGPGADHQARRGPGRPTTSSSACRTAAA
jgi:2-oxoglutarate dehydrogenase E1 component